MQFDNSTTIIERSPAGLKERLDVLFIEDDILLQNIVEKVTEINNHPIDYTFASSLSQARLFLKEKKFDAVVSDYYLPDGRASDILIDLKHMPVIVITGVKEIELAVGLIKEGAADYLVKDSENKFIKILPNRIINLLKINESLNQLKEQESRYRDLFENTNDLVQCMDKNGKFIYTSPSWHKLLGYSAEEIEGITFSELIYPEDKAYCNDFLNSLTVIGRPVDLIIRLVGKSGEVHSVTGNLSLTHMEGYEYATRGIFQNLSAQRTAESLLFHSEKKYQSLLENNEEVIYRTDLNGILKQANIHAERLTGRKNSETIGKHFTELINSELRQKSIDFYANQMKNGIEVTYFEFRLQRPDKSIVWIGQKAILEFANEGGKKPKGFTLFMRDITAKKLSDQKILDQQVQLKLTKQNVKKSLQKITETNASKKAILTTVVIALLIYFLMELFVDEFIEKNTSYEYASLIAKGLVALFLIPLEMALRSNFKRKALAKFN